MLAAGYANAQHNLVSGYIITNDQDTLHGFLKYENDRKLNERVLFYADRSDKTPEIYTPDKLKGFSFSTGRTFISFWQANDSARIFAKKIVWGKINVYVANPKKSGYYLTRSDTALSVNLSPPKQKTIQKNGKTYTYYDKSYTGMLSFITDNQKSDYDLNTLKYRQKEIKRYISSYNEGYATAFPSGSYQDSIRYSFDLSFGMPVFIKSDISHFRGSFYVVRNLVEHNPVFSFQMGVSYRYRKPPQEIDSSAFSQTLKIHYISILPLGVRIAANTNKVVPYGHFSAGLLLVNETYYYNNNFNQDTDNFLGFSLAFNAGAGVRFRITRTFYITAELTPSIGIYKDEAFNLFFNLGVSF